MVSQRRASDAPRTTKGPVLLLGAGLGEATCGILYLASYLRRHDIEAFVRLTDEDETVAAIEQSLEQLMARVKPSVVGISFKWFHHLARTRVIAEVLKRIDPTVSVVVGGNSATFYANEVLRWPCVDHVILGDGEGPLLALCRGDESPPNVMSKGRPQRPATLGYVQGVQSSDVYYSHFEQLFLSGYDRASFSGWVAPGKGCGENCLYCGGTRGMQKATFGRAKPFLRPMETVQKDHAAIAAHTWQMRYDFAGSSAAFLKQAWQGVDLSQHSTTYFLWGVPPPELAEVLASTFARAFMVLDIGCFSQTQRLATMQRGLLKPCPTDEELFAVIERCQRFSNLELEISGIAGLPFATAQTLKEERRLVERVLGTGCGIGYQRLEAQPGALVTEHPERFAMVSEAQSFDEFFRYFSIHDPADGVPMLRFKDAAFERAVAQTSLGIEDLVRDTLGQRQHVEWNAQSKLVNAAVIDHQSLGDWLGAHRVPPAFRRHDVTTVRSVNGAGLACVPTLDAGEFDDAALQPGDDGAVLLAVFDAFSKPTSVANAAKKLRRALGPAPLDEVIDPLVQGRFLARAPDVDSR